MIVAVGLLDVEVRLSRLHRNESDWRLHVHEKAALRVIAMQLLSSLKRKVMASHDSPEFH